MIVSNWIRDSGSRSSSPRTRLLRALSGMPLKTRYRSSPKAPSFIVKNRLPHHEPSWAIYAVSYRYAKILPRNLAINVCLRQFHQLIITFTALPLLYSAFDVQIEMPDWPASPSDRRDLRSRSNSRCRDHPLPSAGIRPGRNGRCRSCVDQPVNDSSDGYLEIEKCDG